MIPLPWNSKTAPHLVLEIAHGCNVVCRGCYKEKQTGNKTLAEIEQDLGTALRLRRVHTVSIAGAEPTLHPKVADIVAMVRKRGLKTALITNGLCLDNAMLTDLARAGLDVVMVHVDEGQQRTDLSPRASLAEVNELRLAITRRVAAHGIDAGLCTTIYPDTLANLGSLIQLVLDAEHIGFLFATQYVNVQQMAKAKCQAMGTRTQNSAVAGLLAEQFGLAPFAGIEGNGLLHWMSYFVPVVYSGRNHGASWFARLKSGALDRALLSMPRWVTGRYCYYTRQTSALNLAHLILNSAMTGQLRQGIRALVDICRGGRLMVKRMVFDHGLLQGSDGRPYCLDFCPNATVRNGSLAPVCLADFGD